MHALRLPRVPALFFLLATAIVAVEAWICLRVLPTHGDADRLAGAVLADLMLLIPGLYYWLEVRRNGRDLKTTIPVVFVCLWLSIQLLPDEHTTVLQHAVWLLPALELGLLAAVAVTVGRRLRAVQAAAHTGADAGTSDLLDLTRDATRSFLGPSRAASILAYEMAVFAYAAGLRRKTEPSSGPGVFSNHRRTAFSAYSGVLLFVLVAEIVPIHLLLERWSPVVAWIVFGLSLYGVLWVLGDARAVARRPMRVEPDGLRLRLGLRWSLDLAWPTVDEVRELRGAGQSEKDELALVPLGAGANIEVRLRIPQIAEGPYGIRKPVRRIVLYVDCPGDFCDACHAFMADASSVAQAQPAG